MPKLVRRKHPRSKHDVLMPDYVSDMFTDNVQASVIMWSRMLQAQRDMNAAAGTRTHPYIAAYAKKDALARCLSSLHGMAPFFWEVNASETVSTAERHMRLPDYDPHYYPVVA